MSFPIDFKSVHNPYFRKLNKAISKHQYEVTEYNPDGSYSVKKVKIADTNGRIGKEMFYELRYQATWRLIGIDDYNRLYSEWQSKNKELIEKSTSNHQEIVVELNHENAID